MPHSRPTEPTATSRRAFFSGAAVVGASAAVVASLPQLATDRSGPQALPPAPENGGGYSLSEHVKRYYKTAMV